jgi:hypothetical protein
MNTGTKLISVIDFAKDRGLQKQLVFKKMRASGIEGVKRRGGSESRGQLVTYLTEDECTQIIETLRVATTHEERLNGATIDSPVDQGFFYLLQLEPDHDPERYKVGFAIDLDERIRKHRCSAPLLRLVASWPCKRLWERTAIDCVSMHCERIHTEVFRARALGDVQQRGNEFFALMNGTR